jgi:hypothetical protein
MGQKKSHDREVSDGDQRIGEVPGILITHGGWRTGADILSVGLRAFVYGEKLPASPTLPFGRWKRAS